MAKFTKLNIGDAVASGGGRVWKKLSAESETPTWNGTDLTETTWYVPRGWSAEAGYGQFSINGQVECEGYNTPLDSSIGDLFNIGYAPNAKYTLVARSDAICNSNSGFVGQLSTTSAYGFTITFTGGTDVTNTSLISWLETYGELQ